MALSAKLDPVEVESPSVVAPQQILPVTPLEAYRDEVSPVDL
jgi:hypothetical protein